MLAGHFDQMRAVRRVSSPYNVNAVALACLPEALADQEFVQQYVTEVCASRTRLERAFEASGIPYWPSHANFLLARIGPTKDIAAAFAEHMRQRGILVRDRSSDPGCEGCVRITLGPREHTDRLLIALQETTEHLGITQGASRR
jgi:histidinol-phosphate aminotransferase